MQLRVLPALTLTWVKGFFAAPQQSNPGRFMGCIFSPGLEEPP
jgi:hypothetical protein